MISAKKVIISTSVAVVLIAAAVCFLPLQRNVDVVHKGVLCRTNDPNYKEDVNIEVKGKYRDYLFRMDTFKGTIVIDKYDFTSEWDCMGLIFHEGMSQLTYNEPSGVPNMETIGFLFCTPNFDRMMTTVFEPIDNNRGNWSGEDGLFISAPAETREQALQVVSDLAPRSDWLTKALPWFK